MTGWRRLAFAIVLIVMLLWTLASAFVFALLKIPACGGEACEQAAANTERFLAAVPFAWVAVMVVGSLLLFALRRGRGNR